MYEQHMNRDFIELLENGSRNGDLDVMQKILIPSNLFSEFLINNIFRNACENGHLNVAQWLYQIKPYINISDWNEEIFRRTCKKDHLIVAQWLYQI